jgi:hypothetical protein
MDQLHAVLRSIRKDMPQRDHLAVFREFLTHLDRAGKAPARSTKAGGIRKRKTRRGKR